MAKKHFETIGTNFEKMPYSFAKSQQTGKNKDFFWL